MNFVIRKSEARIADPHYLMEIPSGALVVAPEIFFARFGNSFSTPQRDELSKKLDENVMFHAVPSDNRRKPLTPFVVRRIHSSRVKDALAGKLTTELLNPRHHMSDFMDLEKPNLKADEKGSKAGKKDAKADGQESLSEVNIFSLTLPQLRELATKQGLKVEKKSRGQLTKELQALQAKASEEK